MTIKSSGTLGLNNNCTGGSGSRNQIGAEVGDTARTTLSLNCSTLRSLAGKAGSGTRISFSDFYGKSSSGCATYFSCGASSLYTWFAPAGVTSVSVVAIGGGGGGACYNGSFYAGGGGGGLGWRNNISVTPGSGYNLQVGNGSGGGGNGFDSWFISCGQVAGLGGGGAAAGCCCGSSYAYGGNGGSYAGGGGGYGGNGGSLGWAGGAGGYSGSGGTGQPGYQSGSGGGGGAGSNSNHGGGGVGYRGQGASGGPGQGGSGGSGAASGGNGVVRIVWPGTSRSFPSTNVG